MATPTPERIAIDTEAQTLTVEWADGQRSVFPLDGLRRACPCAQCRGGHENMGKPPDPSYLDAPCGRASTDVTAEPAGSYGLRLTWDDGHNDGIYTWKRLRALGTPSPGAT
mgnify:CR=1 FL=1